MLAVMGVFLLMIFTLLALILVIGVFTEAVTGVLKADVDVVAKAASCNCYQHKRRVFILRCSIRLFHSTTPLPQWGKSLIAIGLLVLALVLGQAMPMPVAGWVWPWVLFGYITVAAITPVNILLQPRDFLSSFLLLFLLIGGIAGAILGNQAFHGLSHGYCLASAGPGRQPTRRWLVPLLFHCRRLRCY